MQGMVTVTLSEALRHAYAVYKAGKLDVAELLCLQVVEANAGLSARLFRQNESRAWPEVIARVHAALQGFVSASPQRT